MSQSLILVEESLHNDTVRVDQYYYVRNFLLQIS